MLLKKLIPNEKGQSAVIAGIAIFMVIAMSALALDIGFVHIQSSREQTAADAAALAGCQTLFETADYTAIRSTVQDYVEKNGFLPQNIESVEIRDSNTSVRVVLKSKVGFGFARVLGFTETEVTKAAKAQLQTLTSATGALPLGVENKLFKDVIGSEYGVKDDPSDKKNNEGVPTEISGFFGWLDLDGNNGGCDIVDWITNGYEGKLELGSTIFAEAGNMKNATELVIKRYNSCPHVPKCTPSDYENDCPRVVTLVIYEVPQGNPPKDMIITGFADFLLLEPIYQKPSDPQPIIPASYIKNYTYGGGSMPNIPDYELFKITLVE